MGKIKNIVGTKFGRLTVLKYLYTRDNLAYWLCKCDCGNIVEVKGVSLRSGLTKSCGCLFGDIMAKRTTHGDIHSRLYNVWACMKQRCYNPNHTAYNRYGGRGITVCDEWLEYVNFKKWAISKGYDETAKRGNCTLDRIDNDKGYSPNNCRWVDMKSQSSNRHIPDKTGRPPKQISINGEERTYKEWAERLGISLGALKYRVKKGYYPV